MALGATIHKVRLGVSDMDRNYYRDFELTVAKHPSETALRMMARIAVFALHADERLAFTRGIVHEDEPDLWRKNYADEIECWIDLGQPDGKRVRKACGRAEKVYIYTYVPKAGAAWWRQQKAKLARFPNLEVRHLFIDGDLEAMAGRTMQLQANVMDGELTLSDETGESVTFRVEKVQG